MSNNKISLSGDFERILSKHAGKMSFKLAKAVVEQFGGEEKFNEIYETVASVGVYDMTQRQLKNWQQYLDKFFIANKSDIKAYANAKLNASTYESIGEMLQDGDGELSDMTQVGIISGFDGHYSSYYPRVRDALSNMIADDFCAYCVDYSKMFLSEKEESV